MSQDQRTFATLDTCPQCGGIFVDPGEAITALGHSHDLEELARNGHAQMVGPSAIACPGGHGAMTVYRVQGHDGGIELDLCPTCAGVFFDAGEADLFKELASRVDEVVTVGGARFSAPPPEARTADLIDEKRATGESAFSLFFGSLARGVAEAARRGHYHRRRRWR
jgi:Zn-finger nucleic acid-binding protein